MRVEVYESVPAEALEIRHKVFIEEQGFHTDLDETDSVAVHFLLFDDLGFPVATCIVFTDDEKKVYTLGRLAVLKEHRGKSSGSIVVRKAEEYVKKLGGVKIQLHAQLQTTAFYEKSGFSAFGDVEYEQGCPHITMIKNL